jgi:threonine aldolase
MIDLRSDTVSKPTPDMRRIMAEAEVGDDVYGDDPSVLRLEQRTAEILGKEAAVYMPTGTMSNQVALRTHTEAGDEILADIAAHVWHYEGGAPAALSGLILRPLMGRHGIFTADDVHRAIRVPHRFMPDTVTAPTKLVCAENTHNNGGGTIWPIDQIKDVAEAARSHGLATHLDGARLWHAAIATGVPESSYASPFDTVSVCFSKGLGAPLGSALAGSKELIARARRFKQVFGGGFRQAGIVAAGALYALENHRERLAEDHENAAKLARGLEDIHGIDIDTSLVQTNIVRFQVSTLKASELVERCHDKGLYMLPGGRDQVRAVTHIGVTRPMIDEALSIMRSIVAS